MKMQTLSALVALGLLSTSVIGEELTLPQEPQVTAEQQRIALAKQKHEQRQIRMAEREALINQQRERKRAEITQKIESRKIVK
ncbi:hypothetical protein GTH32_05815 [Alteromonas sp. 345S023]|uniref:Uncharacterized protein n=1 Tax=Alteromonas profundi TaxID=2696062 RepID=A0A7X5LJY3_9ALTE|nr:hypothetical protein [Alteromonas profundi]NDV90713.1 hypothetical protein [Alteromonas profundi]